MPVLHSAFAWLGNPAGGRPAWRDDDLIAPLLILVLGVALGMCIVGVIVVLHYLRPNKLAQRRKPVSLNRFHAERRFFAPVFRGSFRWIAIRTSRPHVVQAALRLQKAIPCTWEEALSVTNERKLFISPAISGWVLVFGSRVPDPADDVDRCYRFILDLSRKLGHVQFFALNRALGHHAWVQAEQGTILRAYAWAGKTLWNQGTRTPAEIELHMNCYGYTETPERGPFGQDSSAPNAEKLPLLAARWSVDPTAVDARLFSEDHGIAGEISQSRLS